MDDYPRMVFKAGSECRVWDLHDVDTRIVADEAEHLASMDEGWVSSPADTLIKLEPKADPLPIKPKLSIPKE